MSRFTYDHLHLRAADPEALATWFSTFLDGERKAVVDASGKKRIIMEVAGHTLFVEEVDAGTAGTPAAPFRGLEHLGLGVKDIRAVMEEMRAKGVKIAMEVKELRPDLKIGFIEGPEGVRVELLQRG
ncbi:VOC family protein [Acetobacteraceae bacterium H6797]|nr:VOC family protein [Acetobacteraceae bacterium H6797]